MLVIEGWKRILILGICLIGFVLALPNGFYGRVEQYNDAKTEGIEANGWPGFLPSGLVNLGLDLRGGAHLLAEVKLAEAYEAKMNSLWPELRRSLRSAQAELGGFERLERDPSQLAVAITREDGVQRALELASELARPVQSLGGAGAQDLSFQLDGNLLIISISEAERLLLDELTMRRALEVIRRRIDEAGTREPTIQRQGDDRILIQVPGIGSAAELKALIGTTGQLTFQPVIRQSSDPDIISGIGQEVLPSADEEGLYYLLEDRAVVSGEDLVDSQPSFDQNNLPAVTFRFNLSGARIFGDYTLENIGQPFAIVLDNEVVSAPVIRSHIPGGSGEITGNFSVDESVQLAALLRAGALPASLEFLEERTIGPELGQDSIEAGALACIVAFSAVLIFMALSYGRFGIYANIALIINIVLIVALLSLVGATLTLPGIAGIVLTIGMAVDANVLIFERIREELRTAKGPARAIELGYERALSAIIDANITTFITAAILFFMGSGPVRGFAITLGLGIITSVFTAIFITRLLIVFWFERKRPKTVRVSYLKLVPEKSNINFFKRPVFSLGISVVLIAMALGSFGLQGLNYGIDFKGGTTIRTLSEDPVDTAAYRAAIEPLGLGDFTLTEVFDPNFGANENVAMIRVEAQEGEEAASSDMVMNIMEALESVSPDIRATSVESVGPKVSGELIQTAVIAVIVAIAAVLLYIWIRFEWQFAVGAVAALVHDVVLTIGVFSELQIRFDLAIIAALLTIVGYSLNDTVVVFDRVRENLIKYKKKPLAEVLNISINETLSRTFMTSVTTLLALLALFVFGGDVIRGFVFAMIWGVIIGTYSSIFVASSCLLWLGVKRDWSKGENKAGTQFSQS